MIRKNLVLGSIAGLVLVVMVAGAAVTADAQSDSDDGPRWPGFWGRGGPYAGLLSEYIDQEALDAELAQALGMTADEFDEARSDGISLIELAEQNDVDVSDLREIQASYIEQAIQEALESGAITEWLQEMPGFGLGRFGFGIGEGVLDDYLDLEALSAALAGALGITAEEFEQAREQGMTLFELANQYEVELSELREIQAEYIEQAIEAAVEDGAIDPELAERLEQMPGPGLGLFGGRMDCPERFGSGPRSGAGLPGLLPR